MGLSNLMRFGADLAFAVFGACGLIVFLAWVVVRAIREVRDILREERDDA